MKDCATCDFTDEETCDDCRELKYKCSECGVRFDKLGITSESEGGFRHRRGEACCPECGSTDYDPQEVEVSE